MAHFPLIAAPGTNVISSISSYNTEDSDPEKSYYSVNMNGRDYHFTGYTGTSMAAPAMTGVVALWLEADPTLPVDYVRDIVMETAIVDDNVENAFFPVQFGAGKVDAMAGLKRVLGDTTMSVKELNERSGKNILIELKGDRTISVFAANETQLNATLAIIPTVVVFSFVSMHLRKKEAAASGGAVQIRWRSVFPWFILGFLAMAVLSSVGVIPAATAAALKKVSKFLMVTALAAVGLNTSFAEMKKSGAAPMVHGFLISALVVLVALAVEYFMGILPF